MYRAIYFCNVQRVHNYVHYSSCVHSRVASVMFSQFMWVNRIVCTFQVRIRLAGINYWFVKYAVAHLKKRTRRIQIPMNIVHVRMILLFFVKEILLLKVVVLHCFECVNKHIRTYWIFAICTT